MGLNQRPERAGANSDRAWTIGGTIFSGVIALANVFIAIAIYLQLAEMKNESRRMDDAVSAAKISASAAEVAAIEITASNKAQLRARLTAVLGAWNFASSDISKWLMDVTYENVGKTPARAFRAYGALMVLEFPLRTSRIENLVPSVDDLDRQGQVIQPGDKKTLWNHYAAKGEATKLDQLKDDKHRLYAIGHAIYVDIYNEQHYTNFCSSYSYQAITTALAGQGLVAEGCVQFDDTN